MQWSYPEGADEQPAFVPHPSVGERIAAALERIALALEDTARHQCEALIDDDPEPELTHFDSSEVDHAEWVQRQIERRR